MIEYSCGFLFTNLLLCKQVLLIEKRRPRWQAGALNGIGGKIELGETPHEAQVREFEEEAGVRIEQWSPVAVLHGYDFRVHFFAAHANREIFYSARAMTDETLRRVDVANLSCMRVLPNLHVLIPLALDTSGIVKPVMLTDETRQVTPSDMRAR